MRREGCDLPKSGLTLQPPFFQGNRDESTNVDMSLVQRDVQVRMVANKVPLWALNQSWVTLPALWLGAQ